MCACSEPTQAISKAPTAAKSGSADALTAEQIEVLSKAPFPVLLPKLSPAEWAKATVTAGDNWYAVSHTGPDFTLVLEGNGKAFVDPEIRAAFPATAPTRAQPRIDRNELTVAANFLADGVSYSVDVDCQSPNTNPKCTDDAFVAGWVQGLWER